MDPGTSIRFALGECSLGALLVAATERGVCAILLGEEPQALTLDLARRFPRARRVEAGGELAPHVAAVVRLVEQPREGDGPPLDVQGTDFQQRVWRALRDIPPGTTVSYTHLAQSLGIPRAVRAVAQACAANALAVAVPCHRVVRADGQLAGYRWGLERKRELLAREARAPEGRAPPLA